jgi:hypothetical protein
MPMVTSDLLDDVARAFGALIQRELLRVVGSTYDEKAFGNATVTLAAQNFRVRLVRDRGQIVAEVACDGTAEDWSSLQRVLHATLGSIAPPEGIVSADEAGLLVEQFYNHLRDACSPANIGGTRARLVEIEQETMKAFLERARAGRN